jgi:c-di-GMP-binding flagellar brake protein YcgR
MRPDQALDHAGQSIRTDHPASLQSKFTVPSITIPFMKIELISSEDRGRYLVNQPRDIERYLRELIAGKSIVAIYGENGRDFVLSTLLEMDDKQGFILAEQGVEAAMNAKLLASTHCTFATTHDQVHIQFSSGPLESTTLQQEAVFKVRIPREMLRLQRREYYRLVTSVINPVKCMINTSAGLIETVVVDISIGGVGVLAYREEGVLKAGEVYQGCRITLPGTGEFALSLSVRTTFDITLKNGRLTHRAGCQFIDLPASVETAIQRYIIRVERERRARYV